VNLKTALHSGPSQKKGDSAFPKKGGLTRGLPVVTIVRGGERVVKLSDEKKNAVWL